MRTLLLVEDDARFAGMVSQVIARSKAGAWRVHQAATASAAMALASSASIDLAIVDLGLPDRSGVALIAELCAHAVPAVAFTVFDGREQVLAAVRAGAVGYLLKDEPLARVLAQLDECLEGHMPVSSRVARYLFEYCRPEQTQVKLTEREREVLDCLMRGCTYQECSVELGIGLGTIQTHVKNLYRKLEVTSKTDAIAWAARHRTA
jgi:DNA-binding NarL/FixJ family response regulator